MMLQTVDAGAITIAYTDSAPGTVAQPTLLLVHGFPLDHQMWQRQVGPLCEEFRVVAPDLRGFGRSSVVPGVATMEQMADDLANLLTALEIERPVVFCGLSMGGYVGWQFWARHRERLAGLVVCDSRAANDDADAAARRHAMAEEVLQVGPAAAEAILPKLFAKSSWQNEAAAIEKLRANVMATDREGIAAAQRGMAARPDMTERLAQIDVPTLVMVGQEDLLTPPEEMRVLAELIPGASFEEITAAGHMAPWEQPAAVNAALCTWAAGRGW